MYFFPGGNRGSFRWGFSKCSFWIICISITRKACKNLMQGS